jgi:hypothetical protein
MAYDRKISRQNPGFIVAVLDDSGSQGDHLPGTTDPKYQWNERYFGIILKELLARSTEVKADGVVVKPRYYLSVIAYGGSPQVWGSEQMDIEAAVERYTKAGNSLGLGGHLGGTDAAAALQVAHDQLQRAVGSERFRDSFPPMLFHLTDGMSQTDAQPVVNEIKQLSTADGNVLVVNAFIGTQTSLAYQGPEDFPGYVDAAEAGPSADNVRLFNMSSEAPECIRQNLIADGVFPKLRSGARLFFDVRTREMLKHVIQVVGSIGSRMGR